MASLITKVVCAPVVQVYTTYAIGWVQFGIKQSKWALPGAIGGLWFIFPAFNFAQDKKSETSYKFVKEAVGTPPQLDGDERERAPESYTFESAGIGVPPVLA
jgi:hypothetical protein